MLNQFQQIVGLAEEDTPFAFADENLVIRASNKAMDRWAELEVQSLVGYSLSDAFSELVGLDRYLRRLLHNPNEVFTLAMINRPSLDGGVQNYFDLTIQSTDNGEKGLLLSITDVTQQTHLARKLQQEENERYLSMRQERHS